MIGTGRRRELAALRRQHLQLQSAFMAEADRVDPTKATEQEVQRLDALAAPANEVRDAIRLLSPSRDLERELESTRELLSMARTPSEQTMWQGLVADLEAYVVLAKSREAADRRRLSTLAGLLAAGIVLAWAAMVVFAQAG